MAHPLHRTILADGPDRNWPHNTAAARRWRLGEDTEFDRVAAPSIAPTRILGLRWPRPGFTRTAVLARAGWPHEAPASFPGPARGNNRSIPTTIVPLNSAPRRSDFGRAGGLPAQPSRLQKPMPTVGSARKRVRAALCGKSCWPTSQKGCVSAMVRACPPGRQRHGGANAASPRPAPHQMANSVWSVIVDENQPRKGLICGKNPPRANAEPTSASGPRGGL